MPGLMLVAFTSGDGKFGTGIYKAGAEHEEYKSGYENNDFISWPACMDHSPLCLGSCGFLA
jgi:hypothetical protein